MSNFSLPSSYDALKKIPATKRIPMEEGKVLDGDIKSYFPTVTVPVGTVIYRGDKGGPRAPGANVPAFFGNKTTAGVYAGKNDKNITKYRVKKEMTLLELNLNSVSDLQAFFILHMSEGLTEDEMKLVIAWFDIETKAIMPSLPLKFIVPTMNMKNASGNILYLNRFMSNLVCLLGFDGWIVFPYDPSRRQGLLQMTLGHGVVPYSPEIMLCNWTEHMEQVTDADGGCADGGCKKTRKARKTRKHSRKCRK